MYHRNGDLFTCKDNLLVINFWRVKISCFRTQAHPIFDWCLWKYDKKHISYIFLDWALMEEIWNHPASISVYRWLMCKVASTDLCNVLYSFLSLNVFNKYFTKQIIIQCCSGLKLQLFNNFIILYRCNVSFNVMPTSMFLLIILLKCSSYYSYH